LGDEKEMKESIDTVIVGGSQAGLAVSYLFNAGKSAACCP
jgi:hypothetical protein